MSEQIKAVLDWSAVGAAVGTIAGWLPPLAALLSIVWLGIQIFDRLMRGPR
jgi:hypothetical protein